MSDSNLKLSPNETDVIGLTRKLILATGIIERGGRPPIVQAVCQLSKALVAQLHKEIHGRGPSSGLLPYDTDWIAKSPANCLHASIYFNIFKRLSENTSACKGEVYLAAYIIYEKTLKGRKKVLNINRAWNIGQQVILSQICIVTCTKCRSSYLTVSEFPDPYRFCPICDASTDNTGRQKWKNISTQPRPQRRKRKKAKTAEEDPPTGAL